MHHDLGETSAERQIRMTPDAILLAAAILAVAVAGAPAAAHLFEMPAKLRLPRQEYLVAQKLYRGWAIFGFAVAAALVTTGGFAWVSRDASWLWMALAALACLVATQVVFWAVTAPANKATGNWTELPPGWERIRRRWEYSHAASALLDLAALLLLLGSAVLMIDGGTAQGP